MPDGSAAVAGTGGGTALLGALVGFGIDFGGAVCDGESVAGGEAGEVEGIFEGFDIVGIELGVFGGEGDGGSAGAAFGGTLAGALWFALAGAAFGEVGEV